LITSLYKRPARWKQSDFIHQTAAAVAPSVPSMAGLDLSAADAAGPARQLLAAPRVMGVGAGIFILGLFL
jgi:hypothetical protein